MPWESLWHLFLLVLTLTTIAGVVIALLAPLLFDSAPPSRGARRWLGALAGTTVVLYFLEWRVLH